MKVKSVSKKVKKPLEFVLPRSPLTLVGTSLKKAMMDAKNDGHRDFSWLNLSNQDLSGIDLSHCYFNETNFTGANLKGTNMSHSKIDASEFVNANLSKVDFHMSSLTDSDLSGATVEDTKFINTLIDGVDFDDIKGELSLSEAIEDPGDFYHLRYLQQMEEMGIEAEFEGCGDDCDEDCDCECHDEEESHQVVTPKKHLLN